MAGNDRPTKAQRREEARRKAAELRAKQERERRRNKIIGISLVVLAVVAIGVGIFTVVKHQRDIKANKAKYADAAFPRPDSDDIADYPDPADVKAPKAADPAVAGVPVSQQGVGVAVDGGVTVDMYLDFMCPGCGGFERSQSAEIQKVLTQDDVTVVYHVVSIMDRASKGTNYSSRAANAAYVVADQDPEHFPAFVTALFEDQPEEPSTGLTDEKIARIAQAVGVPTAVTDQFTKTADFEGTTLRTFVPWTAAVSVTLPADNPITPSILINGERWEGWREGQLLSEVVEAARNGTDDPTGGEG